MSIISSYSFGNIEVNGAHFDSDILILPDGSVESKWWRKNGHELCLDDISKLLETKPDTLVVGTGADGMMKVLVEVEDELGVRGIRLIVEKTIDAVREYNELVAKDSSCAAALHLTC